MEVTETKKNLREFTHWDIRFETPPEGRLGVDLILFKSQHFKDSSRDKSHYVAVNIPEPVDNVVLLKYIKEMLNAHERSNLT